MTLMARQRIQLVNCLFRLVIQKDFSEEMFHFVLSDLLSLLLSSMEHLFKKGKQNTAYYLCKA